MNKALEILDQRLATGEIDIQEHQRLVDVLSSNSAPKPDVQCPRCSASCSVEQEHCLECGSRLRVTNASVISPELQTADDHIVYASGLSRLGAYLIDVLIAVLIQAAIGFCIGLVVGANGGSFTGEEAIWQVLGIAVILGYFTLGESSSLQGSVGKKALGLRVVTNSGERLDLLNAFGRTLGKFLAAFTIIGLLMLLWTKRKQGLHDFMASTLVVKA